MPASHTDRELLRCVARTSLRTKLHEKLADQLTDIVTDAALMIRKEGEPIDLHMVGASSCLVSDARSWPASGSLQLTPCSRSQGRSESG